MEPLFQNGLVYPSDNIGPYVDLPGTVVTVDDDPLDDHVEVKVDTGDRGIFSGWILARIKPDVGCLATVRVYRAGGGFYPDNRIVGWSRNDGRVAERQTHPA